MADKPQKARKKILKKIIEADEATKAAQAKRDADTLATIAKNKKTALARLRIIKRERAMTPKIKEGPTRKRGRVERKRVAVLGRTTSAMKGEQPPEPYPEGRSGRQFGKITQAKADTTPKGKRNITRKQRGAVQTLGPVNPVGRRQSSSTAEMFGDRRALTILGDKARPGLEKLGNRLVETMKEQGLPITRKEGRRLVVQFLGSMPISESALRGTFDLEPKKLGTTLTKLLVAAGRTPKQAEGVHTVAEHLLKNAGNPAPRSKAFEGVVDEMDALVKKGSFIQQLQIGTAPVGGRTNIGSAPPLRWRDPNMLDWPHVMHATAQNTRKPGRVNPRFGRRTYLSPLVSYTDAGFISLGQVGQLLGGPGKRHALLGQKAAIRQLLIGLYKLQTADPRLTANLMKLGTIMPQLLIGDQFAALNLGRQQPRSVASLPFAKRTTGGSLAGLNIQKKAIQEAAETPGTIYWYLNQARRIGAGEIQMTPRMEKFYKTMGLTVQVPEGAARIGTRIMHEGVETGDVAFLEEEPRQGLMDPKEKERLKRVTEMEARKQIAFLEGQEVIKKLPKGETDTKALHKFLSAELKGAETDEERIFLKKQLKELGDWEHAENIKNAPVRHAQKEMMQELAEARKGAQAARSGKGAAVQFSKKLKGLGGAAGLILMALLTLPHLMNLGKEDSRAA